MKVHSREIVEAIKARKSIRAFKPDPVLRGVLVEILQASLRAPSWADIQPWGFAVVQGQDLERLKDVLGRCIETGAEPTPDIPLPTFPDLYRERSRHNTESRSQFVGTDREDRERRRQDNIRGACFFEASTAIIVHIDKALNSYALLDMGFALENLMIAALGYGLGTCCLAASARYARQTKECLGLPDSRAIVVGVAIGYPDMDNPVNHYLSLREPLENMTTWHGFPA